VVTPDRLRKLDRRTLPDGTEAFVAVRARSRLLGLAWLDAPPRHCALLLPGCRSVHTFGMRFALDVDFLDGDGQVVRSVPGVQPRRIVWCREARAVLERRAAPR
jgi:uncharacterized membrane protein (UPF0127 family)